MRHKDKAILYWFGPPESKTLRPVLRFILLRSQLVVEVDVLLVACVGLSLGGRPCPPYIGRRTRSVDRSPGRLQQGNLSLVNYNIEGLSELP
jgi:hypothetical protein